MDLLGEVALDRTCGLDVWQQLAGANHTPVQHPGLGHRTGDGGLLHLLEDELGLDLGSVGGVIVSAHAVHVLVIILLQPGLGTALGRVVRLAPEVCSKPGQGITNAIYIVLTTRIINMSQIVFTRLSTITRPKIGLTKGLVK